ALKVQLHKKAQVRRIDRGTENDGTRGGWCSSGGDGRTNRARGREQRAARKGEVAAGLRPKKDRPQYGQRHLYRQLGAGRTGRLAYQRAVARRVPEALPSRLEISGNSAGNQAVHGV